MKNWIIVLKFIAVVLITNSHLDILYPGNLKFIGSGGSIGNCLFFFCSGYTLYKSLRINFLEWVKKRVSRIYPPITIFTIIYYTIQKETMSFYELIYPTPYWFISAILLFYVLYYFIGKYLKNYYLHIMLLLIIPYLIWYCLFLNTSVYSIENPDHFKWIYYFQIMLLGSVVAQYEEKGYLKTTNKFLITDVVLFVISLLIFLVIKLFIGKVFWLPMEVQFLMHLISFFIIFYFYKVFDPISNSIMNTPIVSKCVEFLSNHTLEIYITQMAFVYLIYSFHFSFPVNIILTLTGNLIAAYLLKKASKLFIYIFSD